MKSIHGEHQLSTDDQSMAVPSARLLTRAEAARALGISKSSLRRREGNLVQPIKGPRGVHLFDETEIKAVLVRRRGVRADPALDGDVAAEVFDRFDRDVHPVDVVKELRVAPDRVEQLHAQWTRLRGGFVVSKQEREQIESMSLSGEFPIDSTAILIENLRESLNHRCSHCDVRAASICLRCAQARRRRGDEDEGANE